MKGVQYSRALSTYPALANCVRILRITKGDDALEEECDRPSRGLNRVVAARVVVRELLDLSGSVGLEEDTSADAASDRRLSTTRTHPRLVNDCQKESEAAEFVERKQTNPRVH